MSDAAAPTPAPTFVERIGFAVKMVREKLFRHNGCGALTLERSCAISNYLRRRFDRLRALVTLYEAGRLPPPRPQAAARPEPSAPPAAAPDAEADAEAETPEPRRERLQLPTRHGWLRDALSYTWQDFAVAVAHLRDAIEGEHGMPAFLAACPQAGRILRPLWRAVSHEALPRLIQLPPRPRRPRRAPSRPDAPRRRPARGSPPAPAVTAAAPPALIPPAAPPPVQAAAAPSPSPPAAPGYRYTLVTLRSRW